MDSMDQTNFAMIAADGSDGISTLERKLAVVRAELLAEYRAQHSYPWIVGFSGGKDSTLVLQLVFEMLLDLAPGDRTRRVHVVSNDTLVESPILMRHIDKMLAR